MTAAPENLATGALSADEERGRQAGLAHTLEELLAPVASIIGYKELLGEEAGRLGLEALGPDLERVREAGRRLHEIVDRLLEPGPARPALAPDLPGLEA